MSTPNSRFIARAFVGAAAAELQSHHYVLSASMPGTCQLTVKAEIAAKVGSFVALELGWGSMVDRVFFGYVERLQPAVNGWQLLHCKELTAAMAKPVAVTLRHPTLRQVVDEVGKQTGITFVLPDKPYCDTAIPCFYADGSAAGVLDNLGRCFGIVDFCWQQQGNGEVYAGSYADSYWAGKVVTLPAEYLQGHGAGKSATLPAVPKLRPLVAVSLAGSVHRLTRVECKGTDMTLSWD